jgi:hypothetical protein
MSQARMSSVDRGVSLFGHNGGPLLSEKIGPWRTQDEAQADPDVRRRPSYLQRNAGPGAPLRNIVGLGGLGVIGRWTLLECGHWREIRDYDLAPILGRKRPTKARCGCCRDRIEPRPDDAAKAAQFATPDMST